MTEIFRENKGTVSFSGCLVMMDALYPMMQVSRQRNPKTDGIISIFEAIPFQDEIFDAAMAGFAIRDARDLALALKEISRILVHEGLLLIIDLAKPDSGIKSWLVGIYWRALAPIIALLVAGKAGLKFGALYKTYVRLPKNSEFLKLIEKCGYEVAEIKRVMMDGAAVILLRRK